MDKVIILGGRSGTSLMARIVEAAGFRLWALDGETEPPELSSLIINNIGRENALSKTFIEERNNWDVAKCPEFAFCMPTVHNLFSPVRYIHMVRPLRDKIESHIHLGWHENVSKRLIENEALRHRVEEVTGQKVTEDAKHNDKLYLMSIDELIDDFFVNSGIMRQIVRYSDVNDFFDFTMYIMAGFLGLDHVKHAYRWHTIKNKKHQAGRWEVKPQYSR